jgi:hypothetical protein
MSVRSGSGLGGVVKQLSITATCVAALAVAGCAHDRQVDLDPKNISTVHRITVVGPSDPVPMAVVTQGEVNAQRAMTAAAAIPFAGVLGAAVAGGIAGGISAEVARETSKPLNDGVAAEKYSYAAALQEALATTLKAEGYDVSTASLQHKPGRFAERLDGVGGQSDLILDIVASATCTDVQAGKNPHFRPVVHARVKLTRPGDPAPIMDKSFLYDDALTNADAFQIKGDPQYDIADYAALKANIKGCLDGIKASAPSLANAIAGVVVARKDQVAAK